MPNRKIRVDWAFRIGNALYIERKKRGLTQQQLAEKSGVRASSISMIETGLRSVNLSTLARICEALGIRMSELFAHVENMGSPDDILDRLLVIREVLRRNSGLKNHALS